MIRRRLMDSNDDVQQICLIVDNEAQRLKPWPSDTRVVLLNFCEHTEDGQTALLIAHRYIKLRPFLIHIHTQSV